tara:strand:+ start:607 stop:1341 length:735 start_codon:yes stop_codon:yes gene_type:complete
MSRLLVLQHLERERPGLFANIAEERGFKVCIFRLDLGDCLPELMVGDLLLVLGGPMSIRDIGTSTYPWLTGEVWLIKQALNQGIGLIGVCLGAQLLAYAAGGDVEMLKDDDVSHEPLAEIGWKKIFHQSIKNNSKLTSLFEDPFPVLHWHGDRILLPTTAELLASSCRCQEQLFNVGSSAYGLQFHIEVDDEMVNRWILEDQEFIHSALGADGQSILKQEQKEFGHKTLNSRLEFLNSLFDLLT